MLRVGRSARGQVQTENRFNSGTGGAAFQQFFKRLGRVIVTQTTLWALEN
jgi:hypothetical protein